MFRPLLLPMLLLSPILQAQNIAFLTDDYLYNVDSKGVLIDSIKVKPTDFALRTDRNFFNNIIHILGVDSVVGVSPMGFFRWWSMSACDNYWFSTQSSYSTAFVYGCEGKDSLKELNWDYTKNPFKLPGAIMAEYVYRPGFPGTEDIWVGLDSGFAIAMEGSLNIHAKIQDSNSTKFRANQSFVYIQDYVFHLDLDRETLRQLDVHTGNTLKEIAVPNCRKLRLDPSLGLGGLAVQVDSNSIHRYTADSLKFLHSLTFNSTITEFRGVLYKLSVLLSEENFLGQFYGDTSMLVVPAPQNSKDFLIFQPYNNLDETRKMESWFYPNPLIGNELKLDQPLAQASSLCVFDLQGRNVLSMDLQKGVQLIALPQLQPGLYLLELNKNSAKLMVH